MTSQDVLKKVWTRPRWVMQNISTESMPLSLLILLIFFSGVQIALNQGEALQLGVRGNLDGFILNAFLIGGLGFLLLAPLYFGLMHFVCSRIFRGQGGFEYTRYALVLSMVPSFIIVVLSIGAALILGEETFLENKPLISASLALQVVSWLYTIAVGILSFWGFYILLTTLAEAHQFSRWRAFFSILLTTVFIAIPLAIIAVILLFV